MTCHPVTLCLYFCWSYCCLPASFCSCVCHSLCLHMVLHAVLPLGGSLTFIPALNYWLTFSFSLIFTLPMRKECLTTPSVILQPSTAAKSSHRLYVTAAFGQTLPSPHTHTYTHPLILLALVRMVGSVTSQTVSMACLQSGMVFSPFRLAHWNWI